jgi:hypothetical protein
MKKYISIFLILIAFSGCALEQQMRKQQDDFLQQKSAYFANPKNSLMLFVDGKWAGNGVRVNCNFSGMGLGNGSMGSSGMKRTPVIIVTSFDDNIRELNSKGKEERRSSKLQLAANPYIMSMTCQLVDSSCQDLQAEAYFDGKLMSSDTTSSEYGVVNISFHVPLAEAIND